MAMAISELTGYFYGFLHLYNYIYICKWCGLTGTSRAITVGFLGEDD